jgi:hypothetical protein
VVAPATVNTINKWAAGIADTLALGLLVEAYGKGLPIVALPYTNSAWPPTPRSWSRWPGLRGWGVTVLYGPDVVACRRPAAWSRLDAIPWHLFSPAPTAATASTANSADRVPLVALRRS